MRRIAVLDAPSNLGLRPPTATAVPGCAKAPGALRDHGLLRRLNARDAGCLTPPRYDPGDWRPGDGVCHAPEIGLYSRRLADRIGAILDQGEFPVVLGGDCSIVLGSALAMHRLGEAVGGRIGLVFVDGHSDFRHPGNASYVGAAAGEDLALVTGRGQTDLAAMEGRRPYYRDIDVVVMGIRAQDEYRLDLQAAGIVTRPVPTLRVEGAARSAQWARDQLADCAGYWVHIDVDVLDPAVMPAVDAPEPGGIAFPELEILLAGLVESPHCLGVEITVFDPDYDPDGTYAEEITAAVVAGLKPAQLVDARPDLVAARREIAGPGRLARGTGPRPDGTDAPAAADLPSSDSHLAAMQAGDESAASARATEARAVETRRRVAAGDDVRQAAAMSAASAVAAAESEATLDGEADGLAEGDDPVVLPGAGPVGLPVEVPREISDPEVVLGHGGPAGVLGAGSEADRAESAHEDTFSDDFHALLRRGEADDVGADDGGTEGSDRASGAVGTDASETGSGGSDRAATGTDEIQDVETAGFGSAGFGIGGFGTAAPGTAPSGTAGSGTAPSGTLDGDFTESGTLGFEATDFGTTDVEAGEVGVAEFGPSNLDPADLASAGGSPADLAAADLDPVDHEPVGLAPVPTDTAPTDTAPTDFAPADLEPTDLEPADLAPAGLESDGVDPAGLESGGLESAGLEPTDLHPAGLDLDVVEPAGVKPAGSGSAGLEPTDLEPAGVDSAAVDPAGVDPVGPESLGLEPAGPGFVGLGQPDLEHSDVGTDAFQTVDRQPPHFLSADHGNDSAAGLTTGPGRETGHDDDAASENDHTGPFRGYADPDDDRVDARGSEADPYYDYTDARAHPANGNGADGNGDRADDNGNGDRADGNGDRAGRRDQGADLDPRYSDGDGDAWDHRVVSRDGDADARDHHADPGDSDDGPARGPYSDAGGDAGRGDAGRGDYEPATEVRGPVRPLGSAPLLDSKPLPATMPGMLRPRVVEDFSLPAQRPAFEVEPEQPADLG